MQMKNLINILEDLKNFISALREAIISFKYDYWLIVVPKAIDDK